MVLEKGMIQEQNDNIELTLSEQTKRDFYKHLKGKCFKLNIIYLIIYDNHLPIESMIYFSFIDKNIRIFDSYRRSSPILYEQFFV